MRWLAWQPPPGAHTVPGLHSRQREGTAQAVLGRNTVPLEWVDLEQYILPEPHIIQELAETEAQIALELRTVLAAGSCPVALGHHMALGVVHMAQEEHNGGLIGLPFALGTCHLPSASVSSRR